MISVSLAMGGMGGSISSLLAWMLGRVGRVWRIRGQTIHNKAITKKKHDSLSVDVFGQSLSIKGSPGRRDRGSSQRNYFAEMTPGILDHPLLLFHLFLLFLLSLFSSPTFLIPFPSRAPLLQILGGFQVNMEANLWPLNHIQRMWNNHGLEINKFPILNSTFTTRKDFTNT